MDKMGAFESYVSAVQTGSLSSAARSRNISQPAISQQITALETLYDTRLLHRDRKGVRMTPSGEILYKRAVVILDEQTQLQSDLETHVGKVAGQLSVTANMAFSQHLVGDVIIQLAKKHKDLNIVLRADDRLLDLAAEGVDLAIRCSRVGNSTGVARKIANQTVIHVATPAYLDSSIRPANPEDLIKLDYIRYRGYDDQFAVALARGSEVVHAPIKTSLTAQFPDLLTQALNSNLGYAKAPLYMVKEAISAGHLEEVLPEWRIPDKDLFLVYPARENPSLRVTTFLDALLARFDQTEGLNLVASAREKNSPAIGH
jgi:DNA-binding transcriptional LysR family regulator